MSLSKTPPLSVLQSGRSFALPVAAAIQASVARDFSDVIFDASVGALHFPQAIDYTD